MGVENSHWEYKISSSSSYDDNETVDFDRLMPWFGWGFGFLLNARTNLEFFAGFTYLVADMDEGDFWGEKAVLKLPISARYSYRVVSDGHIGAELRVPISMGPLDDMDPEFLMDAAVSYRHTFMKTLVVGAAIPVALNKTDMPGRMTLGLIMTAEFNWY